MNTGNKLQLPDVAIFTFCWGTEHVEKSLKAMLIGMDQVDFKRSVLITDSSKTDLSLFDKTINKHNIEVCDMSVDLNSNLQNDDENRSGFCESFVQQTNKYIFDDFCLNVQHDSTIIDSSKWDHRFLNYDYIGAPWPMNIIQASDMVAGRIDEIPNVVGNGGFSLRTRKFVEESAKLGWEHKNEDLNICVFNHETMTGAGIKFAPPSLAAKFSKEHPTEYGNFTRSLLFTYDSFGFHGDFNTAGMNFIENYKKESDESTIHRIL
jgi:hypothetical protein|tara:strand:+ start:81 stop:872 length:792 start_codon:yes stop_codon:yes gene_type:complete